uniref:Uncharacterized protein n=1 Tax=Photinus pyralis TaxID=7054 RepID=A0A1Y1N825_PHOPY
MQTATVTVVTRAPSMVTADYRDLITFTATSSGRKRIKKTAQMYVTNSITADNEEPRLTYRYTSDCTNVLLGDCRDRTWTIEVTAQDVDSGLLQLTSIPKGLYFPNDYRTGTKEPVVAVYGASCCQPKIQITAVDLMNNRKTFTTDAYCK